MSAIQIFLKKILLFFTNIFLLIRKLLKIIVSLVFRFISFILKLFIKNVLPLILPLLMPLSPIIIVVILYTLFKDNINSYIDEKIKPVICGTIGSVPLIKYLFPFCRLKDSEKVGQWEECPLKTNEQCRVKGNTCNRTRRNGHYMCCPSTFFCTPFSGGDCKTGFWYCDNSNQHNGCMGEGCDID